MAAPIRGIPPVNVPQVVGQVFQTLLQARPQPIPPPNQVLVALQILGQDPGLRRPLGPAGAAFVTQWVKAAAGAARITLVAPTPGRPSTPYREQISDAGSAVGPIGIRVTNAFGQPVPGTAVTFSVTGGGRLSVGGAVTTDSEGVASAGVWTLGTSRGLHTVEARVGGALVATFRAVGVRDYQIVQGNGQPPGPVGSSLPAELIVRARDMRGDPIAGITVAFTVVTGGGSVANPSDTTNQDGEASAGVWKVGPAAGPNQVDAKVGGETVASFSATAT